MDTVIELGLNAKFWMFTLIEVWATALWGDIMSDTAPTIKAATSNGRSNLGIEELEVRDSMLYHNVILSRAPTPTSSASPIPNMNG